MTDNKAMAGRLADHFESHSRDAIREAAKEALHREPTATELALTSAGFVMGAGAAAIHLLEKMEALDVAKN
ncbi:MAG: hypothetical protein JZU70_09590 [Chlorobium sp.]|nr:hypothetical protein [Chlorobium sp.]